MNILKRLVEQAQRPVGRLRRLRQPRRLAASDNAARRLRGRS